MNRPYKNESNETNVSFKLPDNFLEKMDEIQSLKAVLEELKDNFNSVNVYFLFFFVFVATKFTV